MSGDVLVTGATGHVGANIVAHLNQNGVRPRVLLRRASRTTAIDDLKWAPTVGDVTDPASLTEAMRGVEVVYHAAAVVSFARSQRARMTQVNVQGTRNVIAAGMAAGIGRLVFTSSVAAIGSGLRPEDRLDEDHIYNLDRFKLSYAQSKRRSEAVVTEAVREHGLSAVIINPALVLGER
ncbi:MAG: NAD-dependent epimerase/dehydratase family protein, partial [Myxococcota bacterium]